MRRQYLFGNSLWQKGQGDFKRLQFATIRRSYKRAVADCKAELKAKGLDNIPFVRGIVESQKFVNGYWETVKITNI